MLIALNFCTGVLESELRPSAGSPMMKILEILDYIFVSIFTVELGLNIFVNWKDEFMEDRWNWFDALIVLGTCLKMLNHARSLELTCRNDEGPA